MAIDLARLSPNVAATILNSSPLGTVASAASVSRQMEAAGLSIGDGSRVNFLRYIAWMFGARQTTQKTVGSGNSEYAAHREDMARRSRERAVSGRDIGPMPPVRSRKRRKSASSSLQRFCETYGRRVFHLKWSEDHVRVLTRLQEVVDRGGQFALAMPRGSGKTSMVTWATLWAMLTGRRKMVVVIGADARAATQILDAIRGELETNELLSEDFPEVCVPLRRLEGIAQRAGGQLCMGHRTMLAMTADELVLPTLPAQAVENAEDQSHGMGAIVRCVGITGRLRGMQARTVSGEVIRPSLVLLDDPQTDESAKSPSQCDDRERLITGAVLGMAGPGETMAALATLTVIRPDDLADRLLTPSRHPDWRAERTRLVYEWGTGEALWSQYAEMRRDPEQGPKVANAFYRANRKAMDAGAKVAWSQRKEKHHLSALQYAWDVRTDRGEDSFASEYQNDPREHQSQESVSLSVDEVMGRLSVDSAGVVPREATALTAGVDVQGDVLYWTVVAWADDGKAWIVDYGTMPEQPSCLYALSTVSRTIEEYAPGASPEIVMRAACAATIERLMNTDWRIEGGAVMRIDAALIDSGWGQHTETIREACKQSGQRVFPSKGVAIGAKATRGLNDTKRMPGDRVGLHWRSGHPRRTGASVCEYRLDVNFWKSWVLARMRTPIGQAGAMVLCGSTARDLRRHAQFAEQLCAEESIMVEAQGKRVEEWRMRRPGLDNHFLDCVVLASVAANMSGISIGGSHMTGDEGEPVVLSQLQNARKRW